MVKRYEHGDRTCSRCWINPGEYGDCNCEGGEPTPYESRVGVNEAAIKYRDARVLDALRMVASAAKAMKLSGSAISPGLRANLRILEAAYNLSTDVEDLDGWKKAFQTQE